ncbi:MAG: CoA transferase [Hoeflea sp.]|uniref:CaiB/BaiF CoA transferase family protein n=1 Tax=Hoeflea sp. TaxID=1940281 RepID=UPI001D5312AD|nr:CaiB/BaiF CoA-transferase family protein [Hoeflea sp.]MBU4530325.1 CoA transferase [Alphaproteobacteria bacterium]MBU4545112.1 CoA transferase [Alphaproteobacteria bacterium]MBU4549688.1 CoA transferase [Alphaproteobacteria bacterium]MBV1721915.1 CoA transferase [Hoeflea sp.]MBV1761265.1 CoA transferase [Hoeflea sp.]
MAAQPFKNLLVISIEQAVAAPFCSCKLADAGARVIKVERPEGDFARNYDRLADGHSSYFVWLNRGKQSVALDLKQPADRAVLKSMLARADVLIQNLARGAMARLGLDAEKLKADHPRLIQCNISGFGETGPYKDKKAYDLLVQAEAGLASITGTAEAPARVGVSVCDIATGMYAYAAILEALAVRGVTGEGAILDVSMFDAMADWMTVPLLQTRGSGENPPRLGLHHASIAPYGAYRCGDDRDVLFSIQNEREWLSFCTGVLGRPDVATDVRFSSPSARTANRGELDAIILEVLARSTAAEILASLDRARIANGLANTVKDVLAHPHLRQIAVEAGEGSVAMPAPPAIRRGETQSYGRVPELDGDGDAIRREFANDMQDPKKAD